VLLLPEGKIKGSYMLDDINNLLNSGDVPNLFPADDRMQIQERLRMVAKKEARM
jgi:dynein heavy chain